MDDSIPAFPTNTLHVPFNESTDPKYLGMTLRDYFAAAVLPSVLHWQTVEGSITFNEGATANIVYRIADAMLRRRVE